MGTWTRAEDQWLNEPEQTVKAWEPFHVRAGRFLQTWIDLSLDPKKKELKLRMGCGFQLDAETNEFMGAVIKIEFNDQDVAHFRVYELKEIVAFLRRLYTENSDLRDLSEGHFKDAQGFIDALEHGIQEAAKFEKGAQRH